MRNLEITPIVYEYRYNNVSSAIKERIVESRKCLFYRSSKGIKSNINKGETTFAIISIITGIIALGYTIALAI